MPSQRGRSFKRKDRRADLADPVFIAQVMAVTSNTGTTSVWPGISPAAYFAAIIFNTDDPGWNEDEVMPAKFDENSLIWVAADQPVKDNSFLSSKILELCADLPIFWLRPTYPKESQRGKRDVGRRARQVQNINVDQFEAAAEEVNTRRQGNRRAQAANETQPPAEGEAPFNPENPYHVTGEETIHYFKIDADEKTAECSSVQVYALAAKRVKRLDDRLHRLKFLY